MHIAGTPYDARHAKQVRQTALIHKWATRIRAIAHDLPVGEVERSLVPGLPMPVHGSRRFAAQDANHDPTADAPPM